MNYDEFVQEEKAIEAKYPKFFTEGKKLADYILIVYNMRSGYKRHEWLDMKGLPEDIRNDVKEFLSRLEESVKQED